MKYLVSEGIFQKADWYSGASFNERPLRRFTQYKKE